MRVISGKYVGELNVKCINCNSYYNYDELLKRDNSKPLNGADGQTMDDLISRAEAIAEIDEYLHGLDSCISEPDLKLDGYKNGLQVAIQELNALPAVDAIPVEWFCARIRDEEDAQNYEIANLLTNLIWEWHQQEDEEREART